MWERRGGRGCSQKKKNNRDEKIDSAVFSCVFLIRGCRVQTSLFFSTTTTTTNKNASATHLHDLLGIPDDFEEKRASGGEQRDEAVSF